MESSQEVSEKCTGDPSNGDPFVEYYKTQSLSPDTTERFRRVQELVFRVRDKMGSGLTNLSVADIGCNTGMQCITWASEGHEVFGLEINSDLLDVARDRCAQAGCDVSLTLGSATDMPWAASCMDVCLMPELLEHVEDWQSCLWEAARILRPGGVLYLSTTNRLCPRQMEYDLPMYSWYPDRLKRRYERLAVTTKPELVNHAVFPAVNWFTPYELIRELDEHGMNAFDHLDFVDQSEKSMLGRAALWAIDKFAFVRFLAHLATPYSMIVAVKR